MSPAAPSSRLRRLFTLRNGVKTVLWTITLLILFYAEENWRGARAWAATMAEWEAKGESFDYAKLIPPSVPDSENLALLSLFKLEHDPQKPDDWGPAELQEANQKGALHAYRRDWENGQLTDVPAVRKMVETSYRKVFPGALPPQDSLEQFAQLYPYVEVLRSAAATREHFRLPQDYPPQQPFSRMVARSSSPLAATWTLTLHGDLALAENKPALALDDSLLNFKLADGLAREPVLVSGLVTGSMVSIGLNTVYNGLARHAWDDAQLARLEQVLGGIDFLAVYQNVLRGELLGVTLPTMDGARAGRPVQFEVGNEDGEIRRLTLNYPSRLPDGWIDAGKARTTETIFRAIHLVDLQKRIMNSRDADSQADTEESFYVRFIGRIFHAPEQSILANAARQFARMQVWIDEARITCGLERYRLAHGTYPESLDALVPASLDQLPHDIMTGEPYRYRLRPDGTFLLYSVGWNQKDDGGTEVYLNDSPQREDATQGDWVWPTPKAPSP